MDNETGIEILEEVETRLAPRYKVLLHDDARTPFELVLGIVSEVFLKDTQEAYEITMAAHRERISLVDVLALEQAEFRVEKAHSIARGRGYPLTFTIEPE